MAREPGSGVAAPASVGAAARHTPPEGWRQALEAELAPLLARTRAPGVALTLFDLDRVLLEAGYGHRDVQRGLPVDADTIFGVASITKTFTAFSLQLLAEDGLLSLDDAVTRYLPFTLWPEGSAPTLRHFLEHTSGLAPTPTMTWLRLASQLEDPVTGEADREEALSTLPASLDEAAGLAEVERLSRGVSSFEGLVAWLNRNAVILAQPGEQFSYSNDGFSLMGGVVERVSGLPFEEFVRRRILEPLGMRRSTFSLEEVLADGNHSTLYAPGPDGAVLPSPAWQTTGRMLGGGMLKSTLSDLRAWVRFLMASAGPAEGPGSAQASAQAGSATPLLAPERVREMARGRVPAGPGSSYGLGLRIEDADGLTLIGHGGSLKGVSSYLAWVPELGVGVVVLSNLVGLPSLKMALMAINAYAGRPVTQELHRPAEFAGSAQEAASLIQDLLGSYASGEPYGRLRLHLDEAGELRAAVGRPAQVVPAFLVGADEVALRFEEYLAPVTFLRRKEGPERGAVWAAHHGSRVLLRQEEE